MGPTQRLALLLGEGVAIARSQPVATAVTSLIVAAVCAVILVAVGQSAAAEARVLETIDDAGTRTIIVSDPTGRAVIHPDTVGQFVALEGVAWALGLSSAFDVRNADLGPAARPVAARQFTGDLPDAVTVFGRMPRAGEGIAGTDSLTVLASDQPVAAIAYGNTDGAIVGRFEADEPLAFLEDGILMAPGSGTSSLRTPLRQVFVMAAEVEGVDQLIRGLRAVIHAESPSQVAIDTPERLVELRAVIGSELAANSRRLMLVVLGVGLVVVALTLAWAVSQRRRDFGRRRALGASRSTVVVLVLTQTAVGAIIGVVLGCALGLASVWRLAGSLPPPTFVAGVAVLTLVTSLAAGVLPGLAAAFRDPVRILRVP